MVISGWGGQHQLPPLLPGLDDALPDDIIFACLSPAQGWEPQASELTDITKRDVWIIPWLEGDRRLWHPQPRVSILAEHIAKAKDQDVEGVIGIHWRTHDIAMNIDALGTFTSAVPDISNATSEQAIQQITEAFYREWGTPLVGESGIEAMLPHLLKLDTEQILAPRSGGVESPEYFPYDPNWGRLTDQQKEQVQALLSAVETQLGQTTHAPHLRNLGYARHTLEGILLLNDISIQLQPAWNLYQSYWSQDSFDEDWYNRCQTALENLNQAPIEAMIHHFTNRVAERGVNRRSDLGVLSGINQKLWTFYQKMKTFLQEQTAQ
jgi:hypothetical protein